ncbi:Transcriptional regulatory protein TyrR [Saliniradius amylolyticus]|uniref:HTH-type transcriptional regulatory protein TyrR n=1 Tax=Saliniradius amylolyticus TaxID=2183582 RepID=A0A2S2E169_9ALTE|nr:transcriptional regulator TyrR [Saliniradius amylolyticus]AWL11339.1 Transcriptional regulatory protein TyrR [Saliniradius amylolyticus]
MRLEISCQDRLGITQDVLDILVEYEIDLRGIEIVTGGKIYLHFPNIDFEDFQHLMPRIRRIPGIDDVKTTPFMPGEREQHQLRALLRTLPDPVFSIDTRGNIVVANEAVVNSLESSYDEIVDQDIEQFIQGFNFHRWLEGDEVLAQTHKVKFIEQDYLVDLLPIDVPDTEGVSILAGAVVVLKSEHRLGQQMNALIQPTTHSFARLQTSSPSMKRVVREAQKMAELDAPLLICGETGTGKEQLARACHEGSRRAENEFVVLNCASIPDDMVELELFGCASGAYGNNEARSGLLEQAENGTLLLDEVGSMSPHLQSKLLRFLQDGSFRRVGGDKEVTVNLRIISVTQSDLSQLVQEEKFREDLYYRLNVLTLTMPPLRQRKQDIIGLTESFMQLHSRQLGRKAPKLNRSAVELLQSYPWPGNVRQLENAIYRALTLLEKSELSKDDIELPGTTGSKTYFPEEIKGTLDQEVKRFERDLLRQLYPSYPSTRQLAKKLGLSHTAIANKLREYGINKKTVKI